MGKATQRRRRGAGRASAAALLVALIAVGYPASGTGRTPERLGGAAVGGADVAAATKLARSRLGADYGGAWIDRSSGAPVLVIASAGPGSPAAIAAGTLARFGVELVRARAGVAELERARDRVIEAVAERTAGPIAVDADPRRGAVVVAGAHLGRATREVAAAAAGEAPVVFEAEPSLSARLIGRGCSPCYPPWRAGLPIRSGRALCTGAFTVRERRREKPRYHALTAGHCETNRRQVHVGDRRVGEITANSFRGERRVAADALRFRIPSRQRRAQLALPPPYGGVPVIGALPDRALVDGQSVCFNGRTSGGGCGLIERSDIALRLANKTFTHLWCAEIATRAGDSGGPVGQPRRDGAIRAVGLVGISLQTRRSDEMCFSSINLALRELDVSLVSASG